MPILSLGLRGGSRRVICLGLALAGVPAPAASQSPGGYRVGWGDVAAIAMLAGLAVVPSAAGLPHGPPDCAPCDPGSLWGIDRGVVGRSSAAAATASDVLVLGVMAGAGLGVLAGAPGDVRTGNAAVF